jgi:hypothetical protein
VFKDQYYVNNDESERFCPGCWNGKRLASHITRHVRQQTALRSLWDSLRVPVIRRRGRPEGKDDGERDATSPSDAIGELVHPCSGGPTTTRRRRCRRYPSRFASIWFDSGHYAPHLTTNAFDT